MSGFRKAKGVKSIERFHKVVEVKDYLEKGYVDVDRFIEYCKECPNYNKKWSCPPYAFDVKEKYWNKYKYLHLFALTIYLDESIVKEDMTSDEIDELILGIRHQNYTVASKWILNIEKNNPGSMALDGGHCAKCKRCTRPKNKPCRFEQDIRPAIDAIGGNLVRTADEILGKKILWIENGKVPEYFLFILGLFSQSDEVVTDDQL